MSLQEIRINQNMTRRELAQKAGINFRSLQDYEQGHKKLSSASGDVLLRLSTVLGCSVEELLVPDDFPGAPLLSSNTVDITTIQSQRFYCDKYQTAGRWICSGGKVATVFYYDGTVFPSVRYSSPICCTGSWNLQNSRWRIQSKASPRMTSGRNGDTWKRSNII